MEVKDLMIGDLVLYVDGEGGIETPCKINSLNLNGEWTAQILNSEFIFQGDNNECSVEECLLPIPLTTEILKKNGFDGGGAKFFYNHIGMIWWKENIFIFSKYTRHEDLPTENISINIGYAHELQHALRLCGIDKEIIL